MSSFVIDQPLPVMESKESDQWSSEICDCTDDMADYLCVCACVCVITFVCVYLYVRVLVCVSLKFIVYVSVFSRLVLHSLWPGCFGFWCCPCHACIHTREYGQCLCLPLLDIFGIIPPVTMSMRVSMRQRYGIKVSTFRVGC